jgi:hypothetical protein
MGLVHLNSGERKRQSEFATRAAAPTFLAALLGILLVAVPVTRASENNERTTPNERCEEFSATGRCDRVRHLALEYLRVSHVHSRAVAVLPNVGHAQLPDLDPPAGHRLPNGLLAPLTC